MLRFGDLRHLLPHLTTPPHAMTGTTHYWHHHIDTAGTAPTIQYTMLPSTLIQMAFASSHHTFIHTYRDRLPMAIAIRVAQAGPDHTARHHKGSHLIHPLATPHSLLMHTAGLTRRGSASAWCGGSKVDTAYPFNGDSMAQSHCNQSVGRLAWSVPPYAIPHPTAMLPPPGCTTHHTSPLKTA